MGVNRKAYLPKYGRFAGDGRVKVSALLRHTEPGTHPMSVTRGAARRLCDMLDDRGESIHSRNGATLWVTLEYCRHNHIGYSLKKYVSEVDGGTIGYALSKRAAVKERADELQADQG